MSAADFSQVPVRKAVGIAMVASALGLSAAGAAMRVHALSESFIVPFSRGDTPADGSDEAEALAASTAKGYPDLHVRVTGHAERGSDAAADVALSERRAAVVRDALVGLGVEASRMSVVGAGSSGSDPASRRVVVTLEAR